MFDLENKKVNRAYFQVDVRLDAEHAANKVMEKHYWQTAAYGSIGDAVMSAQNEGEVVLKRVEGGRIIEGQTDDEGTLPVLYVVDPSNRAVAVLNVMFHDYSTETIQ